MHQLPKTVCSPALPHHRALWCVHHRYINRQFVAWTDGGKAFLIFKKFYVFRNHNTSLQTGVGSTDECLESAVQLVPIPWSQYPAISTLLQNQVLLNLLAKVTLNTLRQLVRPCIPNHTFLQELSSPLADYFKSGSFYRRKLFL